MCMLLRLVVWKKMSALDKGHAYECRAEAHTYVVELAQAGKVT